MTIFAEYVSFYVSLYKSIGSFDTIVSKSFYPLKSIGHRLIYFNISIYCLRKMC